MRALPTDRHPYAYRQEGEETGVTVVSIYRHSWTYDLGTLKQEMKSFQQGGPGYRRQGAPQPDP